MKVRWLLGALGMAALFAAEPGVDGRRWWSHVQFLASDKLEGRLTGSEGHRKAAEYVAAQFERAGLRPAGSQNYIQPVKFHARRLVEKDSSLALVRQGKAEPLALGEDAILSMRVDPADSLEAPLVFVGYGLTVPEMHFDDLAGQDLRGKVVVYLSGGPSNIPGPVRSHFQSSAERHKAFQRAGVVGAVYLQNPGSMDIPWSRSSLARFQTSMSLADPALDDAFGQKLAVAFNPAHADKLLAGSGHTIEELLALADAGKPLPHFPLGAAIRAKARVERFDVESQNIVGKLEGSDPALKNEYVALSAHVDHLGVGAPIHGDRIYNGAMDNASGTASLLDIAQSLQEARPKLRRSLLFVVVTGEEKGLLGSRYFAAHPTVPARSIVADLNVDMFLPLSPLRSVTVYGLKESDLGEDVRAVAGPLGIRVLEDTEPQRNIFIRSDQYSFIRKGIPALAFKVGYDKGTPEERIAKNWLKERYHAPSDDLEQPVDLAAAGHFDQMVLKLAEAVANRSARPHWKPDSFFRRYAD